MRGVTWHCVALRCRQALYSNDFDSYHGSWLGGFTAGYPILMIVLFPLIAISLRNNLIELYFLMRKSCCTKTAAAKEEDSREPRTVSKALLIISTFLAAWCVRQCLRACVRAWA